MKTKTLFITVTIFTLLSFPAVNFGQLPYLGSTFNFVLFTITGAVDNTGVSPIKGHVGTNSGDISGFNDVTGQIHNADPVTVQCSADLLVAYNQLYNTAPTSTTHTPAFGSGETLFAGVYSIAAAGSVAGSLNLDAQGNLNAIFIFKFGGAFTTGASTTINLTNGASACNVFWIAEGAISMAASTSMKGTLIANNGAISMGAGGLLEGRMFSTTGAVSTYQVSAPILPCSVLPVELLSFTGACDKDKVMLKWSTTSEIDNNYFTVYRSREGINWQVMGRVGGAGNSFQLRTYSLTDSQPGNTVSYYRLKQTDFNGNYKYGKIISVKQCGDDIVDNFTLYPNPSDGKFSLLFSGNKSHVYSTQVFNSLGEKINESPGFQPQFDLSNRTPGVYFVHLLFHSKIITRKMVVEK